MSRKLPGSAIVPGTITVTQITGGLNDTTNASYAQANTARTTANDAYGQANTARDQANTARTQANTAYDQANNARGQANTAYGQANNAYSSANLAYTQANSARSDVNTTFATVNTTFATLNTSAGTQNTNIGLAYDQANAARGQANTAYGQANAAYGAANTRLSASGGTLSGDLIITGNLTVSGNSTTLNTEVLTVEDAEVVLLSNVASTPALNAGVIVNRGTSTNTFIRWNEAIDEWGWSDSGTTTYYFEDLRAGLATTNTTFGTVNTSLGTINTSYQAAYAQANTAGTNALNAYGQANTARTTANDAYGAANNRVLKTGDTMTGSLNFNFSGANLSIQTQSDYSVIEMGGANGAFIDMKAPNSDDFDFRIITIQGSTNFISNNAAQVVAFSGANVNFDSGSLFVDSVNDRIGIGMTNPNNARLHASGVGTGPDLGTTAVANATAVFGNSDRDYGMYFAVSGNGNGAIQQRRGATAVYYDLLLQPYGGNVGINTTSPGSKLDVVTSTEADSIRINNTSPGVNSGNKFGFVVRENGTDKIFLRYRRDGSGIAELFNTSDAPFVLGANNTEHIRITAAGNLGVGATNPQGKLTISNAGAEGIEFFTTGGIGGGPYFNAYNRSAGRYVPFTYYANTHTFYTNTGSTRALDITTNGNIGVGTSSVDYGKVHIKEGGITAAAISTGWPAYNAETATQSKYVLFLDAGSNGSVTAQGQGPSVTLAMGGYYDSRGIITMIGAGGGSPSDGGNGYGKDLMVKGGNSDNGNGLVGGRLFLAGGSGYSGGAFGSNFGSVVLQPQGGNVGVGNAGPTFKLDVSEAGAAISGTATTGSNMKGIRIYNTTTATTNNAIGLWMATGPHQAGIASFRADTSTWDTCLAFYTHVNALSNLNDATEKMRIHGQGYVTMPLQPRFYVYGNVGGTHASGSFVRYGYTYVNVGSHYSSTNGRFTAPVTGDYYFFWGSIAAAASDVYRFYLYKNGADTGVQLRIDTTATGSEYGTNGSRAIILNLAQNDYVQIYYTADAGTSFYPASDESSPAFTHFGGYLLG